ncbi:four-carbon acid sugar kinase family protein [Pelagicoccus albus]|uniref:Four-carbon acid sugar kinase family protein n=1 Tax=Pelagicoccus albus TaxID=415222 RepID=A0A7X1B7F6_9BACT|nr:four-carbon acid sugar kinase family protein [Pelagicoccus albus]MBC2607061.1 four-carbon acid sugar kinase family protein [Pelagicoccus albus]
MSESSQFPLLLSYYGDDFTGSADVMEALESYGVATALFLDSPSKETVAKFRFIGPRKTSETRIQSFGVAGISRTMSPSQMAVELPSVFSQIASVESQYFHYKICSTFDSSPSLGNIGTATDLAMEVFHSRNVPLVVGAPSLGRFCVFGNLFARVEQKVFRLDRHPTMARHPVTPMGESDLREHLAILSERKVLHMDISKVEGVIEGDTLKEDPPEEGQFLLFDILEDRHLRAVGKWICEKRGSSTQVVVGSSGVEYAICGHLSEVGELKKSDAFCSEPAELLIVLAGSASPGTAAQIEHAIGLGFVDLRINTAALVVPETRDEEIGRCVEEAYREVEAGRSPLLYAAKGPEDPAIGETARVFSERSLEGRAGELIAKYQGEILMRLLSRAGRQRVLVAGGDTSGFATKALGITALEILCPLAPGAPLCLGHSEDDATHGLEICLKGGQNGNHRFIESVLKGRLLA